MRRAWNHALSQARLRRRRRRGVLFFGVFVFGPWPARSQCRILQGILGGNATVQIEKSADDSRENADGSAETGALRRRLSGSAVDIPQ